MESGAPAGGRALPRWCQLDRKLDTCYIFRDFRQTFIRKEKEDIK